MSLIASIGELLIDLISVEEGDLKDVRLFEKHPGGAPANVAVGVSRLGVKSSLISKVGNDPFGEYLIEELSKENVDTRGIVKDEKKHTGIVFVQLKGASPSFLLYDDVAYFNMTLNDINWDIVEEAKIVNFGSVILARNPSRETVMKVIKKIKGSSLIAFDVNLRLDLWRGQEEEMIKVLEESIKLADIVKASEEEVLYLENQGVEVKGSMLTAITLGPKGCRLIKNETVVDVPSYNVNPLDTTGAGDAFMAALLVGILKLKGLDLLKLGKFANLVAALSTQKRGAWSTPRKDELLKYKEAREVLAEGHHHHHH
uniref:Uncharacterized sugar kinase PH1459 n=1 Tax=Pyrococcus horikoshii TaxID=53953 RepID=UPI0001849D31